VKQETNTGKAAGPASTGRQKKMKRAPLGNDHRPQGGPEKTGEGKEKGADRHEGKTTRTNEQGQTKKALRKRGPARKVTETARREKTEKNARPGKKPKRGKNCRGRLPGVQGGGGGG